MDAVTSALKQAAETAQTGEADNAEEAAPEAQLCKEVDVTVSDAADTPQPMNVQMGEAVASTLALRTPITTELASEEPKPVVEQIDVVCGDAKGIMLLQKRRVLHQGLEMSPTEFEKLGGRGASKKWKTSIRIVQTSGKPGILIGEWLQLNGLDTPTSGHTSPTRLSPAPTLRPQPAVKPPPPPKPAPAKAQTVKAQQRPAALKPAIVTATEPQLDMIKHLASQYIGLLPGDPTLESIPDELPAASAGSEASGLTVVDLGSMSHEQLMQLSAASAEAPLSELLPDPPGILPEREAHLTGKRPAKRPRAAPMQPDVNEAAALMGDYMAGRIEEPPWGAYGLTRKPVIGGRDLDLRQCYRIVQSHGGYDAACSKKLWRQIAMKLGIDTNTITNASYVLRTNYQKYLLAYERQARALGVSASGSPAASGDSQKGGQDSGAEAADKEDEHEGNEAEQSEPLEAADLHLAQPRQAGACAAAKAAPVDLTGDEAVDSVEILEDAGPLETESAAAGIASEAAAECAAQDGGDMHAVDQLGSKAGAPPQTQRTDAAVLEAQEQPESRVTPSDTGQRLLSSSGSREQAQYY